MSKPDAVNWVLDSWSINYFSTPLEVSSKTGAANYEATITWALQLDSKDVIKTDKMQFTDYQEAYKWVVSETA